MKDKIKKCKECKKSKENQCMVHALVDQIALQVLSELQPRKVLTLEARSE